MVQIPTYNGQQVQQGVGFRQGVNVQASAGAMGAGVGEGLAQVGRGMGQAARVMGELQALDDTTRAKEADNGLAGDMRELMYGAGGYMTLDGRNAVDARGNFERRSEELRMKWAKDLSPGAERMFNDAAQSRLNSAFQQGIVHSANSRKQWFEQASVDRQASFADDALINYNNPELFARSIAAGQAELRQLGSARGWDAATIAQKDREYVSSVYRGAALRLAQDDPLKAEAFIKENERFLGADAQYQLRESLEPKILDARGQQNAARITGQLVTETPKPVVNSGDAPYRVPVGNGGGIPLAQVMSQTMGMNESRDSATISSFIQRSAGINIDPRVTPWCAAFVNAVLGSQGIEGTGSNMARSFMNFGRPTDAPQIGDIVVLSRGDPNGQQGHVGFFQGYDANGNIRVFGGNQSDGVNVQSYSRERLLGFRTAGRVNAQTAALPNYNPQGLAAMQSQLDAIADPREREATRRHLSSYYEAQSKAMEAQVDQTISTLSVQIAQNPNIDLMQLSPDVMAALGPTKMTTLLNYQEKVRTMGEPTTDDRTLFNLRMEYARDPVAFGRKTADELFEYRDKLSNADWATVTGWAQSGVTDQRKAQEEGIALTSAMSQASTALQAAGITTVGMNALQRRTDGGATERREAAFMNTLAVELEAAKAANNGANPNQEDVQKIINRLLLPVVLKREGAGWFGGDTETEMRMFEAGGNIGRVADGVTVEINYKKSDIPAADLAVIENTLRAQYGRKPSDEEIVNYYERFEAQRWGAVTSPEAEPRLQWPSPQ